LIGITNTISRMYMDVKLMEEKVRELKQKTFEMVIKAGRGHLGGSFSCAEFLVALYYEGLFKYDPKDPNWSDRDIFILSKGHAHNLLYNIFADVGYFPLEEIDRYTQNGALLGGHCDSSVPGAEVTTGSLGHGLGIAAGIAWAYKLDGKPNKVFVLLGDGECQEGSIWEALMFASQHNLNNLYLIVDHNKLGSEDRIENTSNLANLDQRLSYFGWDVVSIEEGHNFGDVLTGLQVTQL
jgi:transketolase